MGVFLGGVNTWIGRPSKADGPPQCGQPSSSFERWNGTKELTLESERNSSCLFELGTQGLFVPAFGF